MMSRNGKIFAVLKKLLNAIVSNGDRYCREHLAKYDSVKLLEDWWEAFDFFLCRACLQGRRDEVSLRVYEVARKVILPLIKAPKDFKAQKEDGWKEVSSQLTAEIGKGKVGKARDVKMIVSALEFVSNIPNKNIVSYSVGLIRGGKLKSHYNEIQARKAKNGITQVGPKIAAFYLRDVVSLFDLSVDNNTAFCLQPVDTWVQKIVEKIGIARSTDKTETIQQAIVSMCENHNISALRFNQGAWYTGYYAFDIVLNLLAN